MRKLKWRVLSLILALAMVLTSVPMTAKAASGADFEGEGGLINGAVLARELMGMFDVKTDAEYTITDGDVSYSFKQFDLENISGNLELSTGTWTVTRERYYTLKGFKWVTDGTSKTFTFATYYNVPISVNGHEDGAVIVDGQEYTSGTVKMYDDTDYVVSVKEIDGFNAFLVSSAGTYKGSEGLSFTASYEEKTKSSIRLDESSSEYATVTYSINGSDAATLPDSGVEVDEEDTVVKLIAKATEEKYKVTGFEVSLGETVIEDEDKNGEIEFTIEELGNVYSVKVITTNLPILEANADPVSLNKYDIKKMQNADAEAKAAVEAEIWKGFSIEPEDAADDVVFEYYAGAFKLELGLLGNHDIPVYRSLNEKEVTVDALTQYVSERLNVDARYVKPALERMGIDKLLANFHEFGEQDTETVRATYKGTTYNSGVSDEREVSIVDGRITTELRVKESIDVVYGNFTDDDLLALALEGLYDDKGNIIEEYEGEITISMDSKDAGVRTAIVKYSGDDEYKDSTSDPITVNVAKANAVVETTDNNIVKYKNRETLLEDGYLYTITPQVVIEDTVNHIPFSMGLDAIDGKLIATLDLSKVTEDPLVLAAIKALGNQTISLDTLTESLGTILELAGVALDESTLSQISAILTEVAGTVDVDVKITSDGKSFIPQNHGVYLVGAVTTDENYNTAYDVTYLVITSEPVEVHFVDEDNNIKDAAQFTYDGEAKSMKAQAFELNLKTGEMGNAISGGVYDYYYVGVQSDGTPYTSAEAPLHAGTYTVTAVYRGGEDTSKPTQFGMAVGTMVIWPSDVAEVAVEDAIHVVDGNAYDVMDMITLMPEDTDAKVAVITAGINVDGDFSEEGLSTLKGDVNVDFPARADKVLKKIVPSAYADGITLTDLNAKLGEIKTKLAEYGIETETVDQLMATIESMPDVTTLTFKEQAEVNPKNIGAYFVAAVVFDPDYVPAADTGILLITPEINEEVLEWNYNDPNGIITLPLLTNGVIDLDAHATKDEANTAKIKYIFVGTDENGNLVSTDDATTLGNGAYTEIAYIWDGISNGMAIAEPIVRSFVVVPQTASVDFEPDENVENVRRITYTGYPIEMPVVVEHLDGTPVNGTLTVRYTGVDTFGEAYDSTEPPTNVGVYTVTATYEQRTPLGDLEYAGMNIGTLYIEPAEAVMNVEDTTVPYDGEGHMATINNDSNLSLIKVVVDEENNVNIILPEEWDVKEGTIRGKDKINKLIERLDKLPEDVKNSEAIKNVRNALVALSEIESLTINGALPVECGEYSVTVIAFGPNYKAAVDQATLTIAQREIKIVIDDKQKYVGEDDPEFTYTYNEKDILEGDEKAIEKQLKELIELTRVAGENVGSYEIYAKDNGALADADSNVALDEHYYISSIENGTLTILEKNDGGNDDNQGGDDDGNKPGDGTKPEDGNKPNDGGSSDDKTSADETSKDKVVESGKTGDNANIGLYLGLALAAMAAIVAVLFSRKRSR